MLSGHSDLTITMDDEEPIHAIEENDQAPIVSAGEFLTLPFVTDDELMLSNYILNIFTIVF